PSKVASDSPVCRISLVVESAFVRRAHHTRLPVLGSLRRRRLLPRPVLLLPAQRLGRARVRLPVLRSLRRRRLPLRLVVLLPGPELPVHLPRANLVRLLLLRSLRRRRLLLRSVVLPPGQVFLNPLREAVAIRDRIMVKVP